VVEDRRTNQLIHHSHFSTRPGVNRFGSFVVALTDYRRMGGEGGWLGGGGAGDGTLRGSGLGGGDGLGLLGGRTGPGACRSSLRL
jgi:hypothetical protein